MHRQLKTVGTLAVLALGLALSVSLPASSALANTGLDSGGIVGRDTGEFGSNDRDSGGHTGPGPGGTYEGDPDTYTIDAWVGEIVPIDVPRESGNGMDRWMRVLLALITRIYLTLLW